VRIVVDGAASARLVADDGHTLPLTPPARYAFAYADGAATIVCSGEAPVDGFWDWRFSVDPRTGALERLGPAY